LFFLAIEETRDRDVVLRRNIFFSLQNKANGFDCLITRTVYFHAFHVADGALLLLLVRYQFHQKTTGTAPPLWQSKK